MHKTTSEFWMKYVCVFYSKMIFPPTHLLCSIWGLSKCRYFKLTWIQRPWKQSIKCILKLHRRVTTQEIEKYSDALDGYWNMLGIRRVSSGNICPLQLQMTGQPNVWARFNWWITFGSLRSIIFGPRQYFQWVSSLNFINKSIRNAVRIIRTVRFQMNANRTRITGERNKISHGHFYI